MRYESEAEAEVFRRLDLSAVFLVVAGSQLPLFAYLLNGSWRRGLTAVVAALMFAGIVAVWLISHPTSAALVSVYAGLAAVGLTRCGTTCGRAGGGSWDGCSPRLESICAARSAKW
jgi:hemolysin III